MRPSTAGSTGATTSRPGRRCSPQITSDNPSTPAWDTFNFCTGQCWYDNFVYTPPGHPDIVYIGGSYQYDENGATCRTSRTTAR